MEEWIKIIKESFSLSDSAIKIFGYAGGSSISKVKKLIEDNKINISHFRRGGKLIKHKRIVKNCPICSNQFETICNKKEKTTCSHACSNSYFLYGINNPNFDENKYMDRIKKVSTTLFAKDYGPIPSCKFCGKKVKSRQRIYCSPKCQHMDPVSEQTKAKISIKNKENYQSGKIKGWSSRNVESYPEKFFKKVLENNNIQYEFNKSVLKKDLGVDEVGNYFLDFFIPEKNIDLEIDGGQHRYRKSHDELRDSRISKFYNVYRIKWRNINTENGKKYIKEEIDKFLDFYHNI